MLAPDTETSSRQSLLAQPSFVKPKSKVGIRQGSKSKAGKGLKIGTPLLSSAISAEATLPAQKDREKNEVGTAASNHPDRPSQGVIRSESKCSPTTREGTLKMTASVPKYTSTTPVSNFQTFVHYQGGNYRETAKETTEYKSQHSHRHLHLGSSSRVEDVSILSKSSAITDPREPMITQTSIRSQYIFATQEPAWISVNRRQ